MPLARRFSNGSVGSNASRRLSLPSTIHGSTQVNPEKVEKIMKRRRVINRQKTRQKTRQQKVEAQDKENQGLDISTQHKENRHPIAKGLAKGNRELHVPQSPTPYWKVAQERGEMSPRETRSTKKKRLSVSRFNFSPPIDNNNDNNYEGIRKNVLQFSLPDAKDDDLEVKKDVIEIKSNVSDERTTPQDMELDFECRSQFSSFAATMSDDRNTESIKNELKSLRETVSQLVEQSQQQPETSKEEIHDLDLKAQRAMIRTEELSRLNSQLAKEKEALQSRLWEMETVKASERDKLMSNTSSLVVQLDATKREADHKIHGLEETQRKLERQRDALQNEKKSLSKKVSKLENETSTMRGNLAENKAKLEALKEEINSQRTTLKDDQDSLKQVNSSLQQELERMKEQSDSLVEKVRSYEEEINVLENDLLPESEKQLEDALAKIAELEQDAIAAREKILKYENEIVDLKDTIQAIGEQKEEERKNFQTLNEASHEAYESMIQELDDKKGLIDELQGKLTSAEEDLACESEKVNTMSESLKDLNLEMNKRNEQLVNSLNESIMALEKATEEKKQLEEKLEKACAQIEKDKSFMEDMLSASKEKSAALQETDKVRMIMQRKIAEFESKLQKTTEERDHAQARLSTFNEREEALFQKLQASDQVRRNLHNRVMQLSGNIRVYVRVRPALPNELEAPSKDAEKLLSTRSRKRKLEAAGDDGSPFHFPGQLAGLDERMSKKSKGFGSDDPTKNIVEVTEPYKDRGGLSARRKKWTFGFDHIFDPSHGQKDIWNATEPLVQSVIDGFNVCVFAYGQTGSGKTFTMLGEEGNEGIVSLAVDMLFGARTDIVNLSRGEKKVELAVELLEVYNEKVRDLLVPNSGPDGQELNLKISANEAVGSKIVPVSSQEEVHQILERAQRRRCVKATSSNAVSSRSHMIFTIYYKVSTKDGTQRVGKLHVCDLAGSERLGKSNANERVGSSLLRETKHINTSLSVLSNVIEKLQAGDPNVPYRESKLTHLLQNSLGGNSKTLAIVCCNPLQSHFHESLCSLRFAAKVNKVDLKAVANFKC